MATIVLALWHLYIGKKNIQSEEFGPWLSTAGTRSNPALLFWLDYPHHSYYINAVNLFDVELVQNAIDNRNCEQRNHTKYESKRDKC